MYRALVWKERQRARHAALRPPGPPSKTEHLKTGARGETLAFWYLRRAGYTTVCVEGDDEAAEILRLTCLEQDVKVERKSARAPALRVEGADFVVAWPEGSGKN